MSHPEVDGEAAILIPALNEAETITGIVSAVGAYAIPFVVDDGSSDGTGDMARRAGARVARHDTNKGYDAALATGFEKAAAAGMKRFVTFDADGQFATEILPQFLQPLRDGDAELVLGVRPASARVGEAMFSLYTKWRHGVPDILCGVKGCTREVYESHREATLRPSINTALSLAALRSGKTFNLVTVTVASRRGKSRFGGSLKGNARIIAAFLCAIVADIVRK